MDKYTERVRKNYLLPKATQISSSRGNTLSYKPHKNLTGAQLCFRSDGGKANESRAVRSPVHVHLLQGDNTTQHWFSCFLAKLSMLEKLRIYKIYRTF